MENPTPPQKEGKQLDLQAERVLADENESKAFFQVVKKRLLNVYEWYHIAKVPAATFALTNQDGNELVRKMQEGDLLRIDIPGPGSPKGNGHDWVKVDKIVEENEKNEELFSITLRPTSNPENDDAEVAHFFKNMATSTFLVRRQDMKVVVEYHGRNELINTDSNDLSDKIRNLVVGLGAKVGLSYSQWKGLIEGLIDPESD